MAIFTPPLDPQTEYREKVHQLVKASPTLAVKFPILKSLAVDLTFHNTVTPAYDRRIKYFINIANAKSVFYVQCSNGECLRGDFNLTDELAKAVAERQKSIKGERPCHGWSSACQINKIHCHTVLRYRMMLGY